MILDLPPLSQTVTPSRTPNPHERDVLYGRPLVLTKLEELGTYAMISSSAYVVLMKIILPSMKQKLEPCRLLLLSECCVFLFVLVLIILSFNIQSYKPPNVSK